MNFVEAPTDSEDERPNSPARSPSPPPIYERNNFFSFPAPLVSAITKVSVSPFFKVVLDPAMSSFFKYVIAATNPGVACEQPHAEKMLRKGLAHMRVACALLKHGEMLPENVTAFLCGIRKLVAAASDRDEDWTAIPLPRKTNSFIAKTATFPKVTTSVSAATLASASTFATTFKSKKRAAGPLPTPSRTSPSRPVVEIPASKKAKVSHTPKPEPEVDEDDEMDTVADDASVGAKAGRVLRSSTTSRAKTSSSAPVASSSKPTTVKKEKGKKEEEESRNATVTADVLEGLKDILSDRKKHHGMSLWLHHISARRLLCAVSIPIPGLNRVVTVSVSNVAQTRIIRPRNYQGNEPHSRDTSQTRHLGPQFEPLPSQEVTDISVGDAVKASARALFFLLHLTLLTAPQVVPPLLPVAEEVHFSPARHRLPGNVLALVDTALASWEFLHGTTHAFDMSHIRRQVEVVQSARDNFDLCRGFLIEDLGAMFVRFKTANDTFGTEGLESLWSSYPTTPHGKRPMFDAINALIEEYNEGVVADADEPEESEDEPVVVHEGDIDMEEEGVPAPTPSGASV
ncbi:hypothetical protein FB45DRAFT_861116 [Roridomyces roridus]|uniref:Uncharacterized protein n=1 Tax=Roridomyces roridus TaxID=1738132 RepID=A0AAD7CGV0_9AGAR|nr:hypothetical protein FB45DRAFT_861116 [Roridomyces roridus]